MNLPGRRDEATSSSTKSKIIACRDMFNQSNEAQSNIKGPKRQMPVLSSQKTIGEDKSQMLPHFIFGPQKNNFPPPEITEHISKILIRPPKRKSTHVQHSAEPTCNSTIQRRLQALIMRPNRRIIRMVFVYYGIHIGTTVREV